MSNAPVTITPTDLATEIGIDPKRLRGYLRSTFPRPAEAKNTSWMLDQEVADAARLHFAPKEEPKDEAPEA